MKPTLSRREVIHRSLRYGGLGAVGGLAAWLGVRSLREECTTHGPCGGCPLFTNCALPKAKSAKPVEEPATYPNEHG